MTTMTPVLLAGFCTSMAAIAVGKLALADDRNGVDIGTVAIVSGIAAVTLCWAILDVTGSSTAVAVALAIGGVCTIGWGLVSVTRHW